MADYAIANQIRPFQLPDIAGIANAMSSQSLNAMREDQLLQQSRQLRGAETEKANLRVLFSRPDFDPMAPGSAREILLAAPTTGAATFNALSGAHREQRQAQGAGIENAIKLTQSFRDLLPSATPENYTAIRAAALAAVPGWAPSWPLIYSEDAVRSLMQKADDKLKEYGITVTALPGGQGYVAAPPVVPRGSAPLRGPTFYPAENIPAAPPPEAPGAPEPRAAGPGMTPAQQHAAHLLRGFENYKATPYFDVNAQRAGYGSDTTTLADGSVVPVRPGMTVSLEDAERDLERRITTEFTQRAERNIGKENFAALPANAQAALISIAYNYGHIPPSLLPAARSGDLTALSRAVAALPANPGRRQSEAAVIAGQGPRVAPAPGAGASTNAMTPNATPTNAMLAPPDATAVERPLAVPDFARLATPRTMAEADLNKRLLDVQQAEAIARAAANVRGDKPPPPPGQRYNAQGILENIPGSPQALATTERRGAQLAAANAVTRDIDRILERLDNAGMPVTGFMAPTMAALASGSPAADVAELRKTIEGNISFNKLNELRQQSPTGGALGNVTDKEIELLKTTLGSLNQNQSPQQFRQNLLNVRDAFMEVIHGPNFRDVAPPAREPPVQERLPGRRNAPPTGNPPTLEQFLERARPANPNASLEDLTAYYNREYGGR